MTPIAAELATLDHDLDRLVAAAAQALCALKVLVPMAVRVCQHDKSSPGRFLRWPKNGQPPSGSFCFARVRIGGGKPQCGSSCFRTVGKDSTLIMTSVVPMEHDSTGPVADYDNDLVLEENGQSERVGIKALAPARSET